MTEDQLEQEALGIPALLSANRAFHELLTGGVPVQYPQDGETRGDFVRLVYWEQPGRNEFWAVNRSIETAQVMEELVQMARKFREAASRGEQLGLTEDEVRFYDALAHNESAARELTDETLKKIAHELTENLRQNITVDWSHRESVRASLRLMVKRILRKYKYPPDMADAAVELVLRQAEALGESWSH